MLEEQLKKRTVIPLLKMSDGSEVTAGIWQRRRKEILEILQEHAYGYTPPPVSVNGKIIDEDNIAFAGKVLEQTVLITIDTPGAFFIPNKTLHPYAKCRPPYSAPAFDLPRQIFAIEEVCDTALRRNCSVQRHNADSFSAIFQVDLQPRYQGTRRQ